MSVVQPVIVEHLYLTGPHVVCVASVAGVICDRSLGLNIGLCVAVEVAVFCRYCFYEEK